MFATPSLGLAISNFDVNRKSHLVLGAINVFSIWQVGEFSVGPPSGFSAATNVVAQSALLVRLPRS